MGFIVFSLENVEKAMVLLCFRLKMLKNSGFIMFSFKNDEKPLFVLLCFLEVFFISFPQLFRYFPLRFPSFSMFFP